IGEGVVSYTYELTTNTDGDDTFDSFAVTITDQDGDSSTGDLVIDIVDDVPTARADSDSVGEDGPLVADGNILTGADLGDANASDGVADTLGADGASLTGVTYNGDTVGIGSVFAAQYGTITIEANGDYRYELDAELPVVAGLGDGETLSEVFTYTITDGDGDPSTTTLTIVIDGVDDPVVINGLDLQGGELTVDEDDLADGSSPDPAGLTQASSFTVDSPDGLAALSIGGTAVFGTGIGYPITLTGDYGTIRIVSVDPVTDSTGDVISATVNYEYVLSDNTLDHSGPDQDILIDSFAVVATDKDGSQDNATLDVEVIDDVPLATDDPAGQASENADIVIDALANDVFGADGVDTADGAKVSVTVQASQGTVTYDPATGLFTYSPNAGAGSGGNTTDSFEYTIIDGDGDSSTATVTVELKPDSEPSGGEVAATVDDDGMAGGNPSSTAGDIDANVNDDPADTSEASFTGSLTFDVGNDTPASIEFDPALDGTTATVGQETVTYSISTQTLVATGPRGVLFTVEITDPATGAYTVTLNDNVLHDAGPDDEDGMANVSLDLIVTDIDGDTAATTLNIAFNDDAPTALDDDGGSVTEGGTTGGNLLTNDTAGADGYAEKAIAGIGSEGEGTTSTSTDGSGNYVLQGSYGTLTVNATTGVYSYQSAANSTNVDATDVFTYSVVDGDGDVTSAKLEIDIDNVAGKVSDNDALVNEAGLPGGSDPSSDSEKDIDGQITVTDASGTLTYTLTGANSDGIGNYGDLVLDSTTGAYTYTLNTPYTDTDAGENGANTVNGAESFAYVVKDHLGNEIGTGSIEVGIVDDVPTAVDETALSIAEDAASPGQLLGNVTGNDTFGADGASVTSFTVGSDTIAVPQDGNSATHTTANGTYTMDMAGNWTFDPQPGLDHSGGPIDAGFSYRLTDGDDDYATATQPITITDGADPDNPADTSLELDDQNLADGSTPAGPDSDSATISFVAGSDPYAGFAFGDTGNLAGGLTWSRDDDTTITGSDGTRLVVTLKLTVVGNDATVTATLEDNYLGHSSQGDELAALGSLRVIATDIDGDQSVGTVTLGVSDDVPTMTATAAADGALTVDESDLSTDASASFASLFTPDYNADGAGSVGGYTLGINAGATGLIDTASGQPVVLVVSGNVVTGRTQTSGVDVFTVSVDAAGTVTLNQLRAVHHDDASDSDDVTALDAANLITLSATASDGDGDTVTAVVNIGGALSFRDDGPAIDASVTDGDAITLTTQDADTKGVATDTDSSTAAFGGAFGVASSSFGADGAGSITWDYTLSVDNAASGLSSDGVPVSLALVGGVVEGRANGELVFTIAVDAGSGAVTLTQHEEIDHALPGDSSGYATQLETLATGLVSLKGTATITDGDGDVALEMVTLDLGGKISFADDGPSVTASGSVPSLEVDETDLATDASQSFASLFTFDFGADGPAASGSATYALSVSSLGADSGLVDTATGQTVLLSVESGVVVGRTSVGNDLVFTLSVDANGIVELDQLRAVEHADPNNADEAIALGSAGLISLTATAKDGDGDTDSASVDVGSALSFRDDGPSAGANATVLLDDDVLGGNAGGTGDDPDGANNSGTLSHEFGEDGGTIAFDVTGAPAGFQYVASGDNLLIQQDQGSGFVTVVTVTLVPGTGAYTVTQNLAIRHVDGMEENNQSFELGYTVSDGDSDKATGVLTINVDDDTPILTGPIADGEITNNAGDPPLVGSLNFVAGADGPGDPVISVNLTGITAGGQPLATTQVGNVLTAYVDADGSGTYNAGDTAVFTLTVDPLANTYTFDLLAPLDGDVTNVSIGQGSSFGVGPSNNVIVSDPVEGEVTMATGWNPVGNGGQFTGAELAAWLAGGNPDLVQEPSVNGSSSGWGLSNNNFDAGEFIRFDFGALADYDGAGPYVPPGGTNIANASYAQFSMVNFGGGDTIHFVAHFTDGTSQSYTAVGGTDPDTLTISSPPGAMIGHIDVYQESGQIKLNLTDIGVTQTNVDIDLPVSVILTDGDGDPVSDDFTINVVDDGPDAIDDLVDTVVSTEPVNAAFVIDFSGSIDNDEMNVQLGALKDAAYELFEATDGAATAKIIAFSGTSSSTASFTDFGQLAAQIDDFNPHLGGSRPFNGNTDFTSAISKLMNDWTPSNSANNQVFFLSDGNPNEQTGSGSNSLSDSVRPNWVNFVANNDVNVTAIGVGNGINSARLQDVDVDTRGSPILVNDFDALVETLITAVSPPVTGNVLVNDAPSGSGISVQSIAVDGVTYTYDGTGTIIPSTGAAISGTTFTATTALGGELTFDFTDGGWSYVPPLIPTQQTEGFQYVVIDGDGDTDSALLSIDVSAVSDAGANFARNDVVITNAGSTAIIPEAVLLQNDALNSVVSGIAASHGASSVVRSGGNIVFTDSGSAGGSFTYMASNGSQADKAFVTVNRDQANDTSLSGTNGSDVLVGRDGFDDELHGQRGADIMFGGTGADEFDIDDGESRAILQGSGDNGRVSGYDTILDFDTTDDYLDLAGSVSVAGNSAGTNGSDSSLTINGQTVKSHAISDGIITFDDSNSYGSALILNTEGHLAAVVDYLQGVDLGIRDTIVGFHVGNDTYVYHQADWDPNSTIDTLVKLAGITIPDLAALTGNNTIAPVALDLDGDGVEFLGLSDGVLHDYGSGRVLTAWVGPDDGLLARSTGSGLDIVFTDDAPGAASDLEGLRLAYDTDGDGRLTAADADWADFGVWQDADSDGSLDEGELASLDDLGIVSIDLAGGGAPYSAANDDVTVVGTSHFTKADGSGGQIADAIFATALHRAGQRTAETASIAATAAALALPQSLAAEPDSWPAEAHVTLAGGDGFVGIMAPAYATDDTGNLIVGEPVAWASAGRSAEAADDWSEGPDLAPAATQIAATLDDVDAVQATAFGTQQVETSAVDTPLAMASDAVSGMEALLLMQAPVVDDATSLAVAADAALGEIAAEAAVDGVVEFFADGEAQAPSAIHAIGDDALAALLDTGIFAGGPGVAAMGPMNDETAAVLEAATHA
ncbi:MAG: hypothetical protein DI637_02910, partial [Citromicrobium sp.]